MDKPDRTTPNGRTGVTATNATEPATPPALRSWEKPRFERIPLNEALSGATPVRVDGRLTLGN